IDRNDRRLSAVVVRGRDGPLLGVLSSPAAPGALCTLDLATGAPLRAPIALGFVPVRPVDVADLDGDGADELVALGPGATASGLNKDRRLSAVALAGGRVLWSPTVRGGYSRSSDSAPEWPLVADLDGDGRAELAVPDWGRFPVKGGYRGVALLDGTTGK